MKEDLLNNFYQATKKRNFQIFPKLEKHIKTQVCVVGGGFAGVSAALELRRKGYQVCLLEAHSIGYGASGRNGGQAIVDVGCGIHKLSSLIGWEKAKKIFMITVEGIQMIRNNVRNHKIDCGLVDGTLTVAQKPRQDREALENQKLYSKLNYSVELWGKEKTQECLGTSVYTSAIYDPQGLHIHPLNYVIGLAKLAFQEGVEFYENTPVLKYQDKGSSPLKVITPQGEVVCEQLVLCANVYNNLNGYMQRRIMPVGTYIAATKPLEDEVANRLIANNAGVCDMNFVIDYYRLSHDGSQDSSQASQRRLLFGGRVSYTGKPPWNLKKSLYQRMTRIYPYFKQFDYQEIFDYAWGGHVDVTINRAPHFGKLSNRTYFLQGFSGHGVALANVAGKIVAEAIDQNTERLDLFKGIPHQPFLGGRLFRTPLLALGMLYFRLKDYL